VSHWYKTKNSMGWRIAIDARLGFKHQVTATPGFHSLYDWCYQMMWLFSGASEDPEDVTEGKALHRGTLLYCEEFDVCHAN